MREAACWPHPFPDLCALGPTAEAARFPFSSLRGHIPVREPGRAQAVLALRIGTGKSDLNHGCHPEMRIALVFTRDFPGTV